MENSFNCDLSKRLNLQFLVLVFLLLLPETIFADVIIDFNTMLGALKKNSGPIIQFVVATAYVMGIWFVIDAILELKKAGQAAGHNQSLGAPLIKLVVGIVLIYLPSTIDVSVTSLWGHGILGAGDNSPMSYTAAAGDPFGPAKEGAIAIVRIIGYVSFVRGLVMLSRSSDQGAQPGTFGKGFMHMVGGVLAINVVETIRIISNTLGFTII